MRYPDNPGPAVVLLSRPYVLAALMALVERPHTLRSLRRTIGASPRGVVDAIRRLAAHGALDRAGISGSWDEIAYLGVYGLTPAGRLLAYQVIDLAAWAARHEREIGPAARRLRQMAPWRRPQLSADQLDPRRRPQA